MDLILWRHAEAHEAHEGQNDLDRALTSKGEKQAARMAKWLDSHLPEGTRIIASPAKRTDQTVQALQRKYKIRAELAPDASLHDLLEVAQWPKSKAPVLLVGHQPTLGQAVAQLLGLREAECSIRKGAVWWLRSRERDGQFETVLLSVQTPELL